MQPLTLHRAPSLTTFAPARVAVTPARRDDVCLIITKPMINRSRVNNWARAGERTNERLNVRNCNAAVRYQKLLRLTIMIHERHAIVFANTICL